MLILATESKGLSLDSCINNQWEFESLRLEKESGSDNRSLVDLKGENMEFENLAAILDFAIEKEIEAAEFYTKISEEEAFSGAGKMFEEFAREERKHQQMLHDFKTKGLTTGMEEYQFKWITDIKRSNYVLDLEYSPAMGYNEILMLAMKREEKALQLYNDFLEKADSEESRTLFKVLCQEEAKHKLALETMYDDYMAQMGD